MKGRNVRLLLIVFVTIVGLAFAIVWRKRGGNRPASVPVTAVRLDDFYVDCNARLCDVYDASSGQLVAADPFALRLKAFASKQGGIVSDCGTSPLNTPSPRVGECLRAAFKNHIPFIAQYVLV